MSSNKNRVRRTRVERPDNSAAAESIVRRAVEDIAGARIRTIVREELAFATVHDLRAGAPRPDAGVDRAAQPQSLTPSPKETPRIEEATRGAEVLCSRLMNIADQLAAYTDERLGQLPPPAGDKAEDPKRPGQVGALLDAVSMAHMLAARIEREINRLQSL
jgi:hypothetical protein